MPPIFLIDLQTLITVLKLLNFALTKSMFVYNKIDTLLLNHIFKIFIQFLGVLINKLNWVADTLMKSESMHHNMADDFKNDDKSKQLVCN